MTPLSAPVDAGVNAGLDAKVLVLNRVYAAIRVVDARRAFTMLAKEIATSADGRTYTFTLRDGVTLHNGAPLTSAEVVWSWQRFLDPKSGWPCRANFDGTRQIKVVAVEASTPTQIMFRLAEPSGAFLSMLARSDCDSTGIAHPDSVGPDGTWKAAIGTGPFKLADWRRGQYVELTRHDAYVPRTPRRSSQSASSAPTSSPVS